MIELIADEFHAYNKAFFTDVNYVVKGWKIEDAGGLTVRVNIATDSLLINSERAGQEGINYRAAGTTVLEVDLVDNATNYVEVEITEETTGEDSVAIWDATANSGDGAEFIQNVDTVTCQEPALVSNTIAYSVGVTNRMKLARVTTAAGAIVSILDDRSFFYHLDTDWDFDGTAFGTTRTDKSIGSVKDAFDALASSIKEMKGSTNWYDLQNVSTLNLLERLNYMLVDGGTIRWDLARGATGSLTAQIADPNTSIADGDTFEISDGVTSVVFEFDDDASVSGGNTPVTIPTNASAAQVATAIAAAITGHAFDITAAVVDSTRIELENTLPGTTGNIAITETLSNGATLAPVGMEGGITTPTLQWSAGLRIVAPSRAFAYTVDAQSVVNIADGELIYVTLPAEGVAPGGALAVTKVASASYPLSAAATRGYILAYRSGGKIYFGNGWHGVELEDGEGNQLGDGPSAELLTAWGFPNEKTSKPPYTSNYWVSPGASLTKAISELDTVVEAAWGMLTGKVYDEWLTSDGTAAYETGAFVTLPPPFGLGANQTYQTGYNQLEVLFNGRKAELGGDWAESANIGAGIGNRIELLVDLPNNTKINFRIQTGGGQTGTVSAGAADVYDEGSLVAAQAGQLNFIGAGVLVTQPAPGIANITISGSRELAKLCKNATGVTLALGTVVAWLNDGTIAPADANDPTLSDVCGITSAAVPHDEFGLIIKLGNAPGVLAGLGAVPGQPVYLSGTPGLMTLVPPGGLGDTIIRLGRAEPGDGVASATADDLWLAPEVIQEP